MKKIIAMIIAVLMIVCSLAACGGDGGSKDSDAKGVVLSDLLNEINTKYNISGLKVLEKTSDLNRYYKIDEADVKQFAAEMTTSASEFNEIIIVEAVDGDAAARIETQLNNHLDTQRNTAKSYTQDQLAMVEKCNVLQNVNFIFLVIGDQADAINDTIDNAVK